MIRQSFLVRYNQFEQKLDQLATLYILSYFNFSGLNTVNKVYSKIQLKILLKLDEKYIKLLDYMIYALEKHKLVVITGSDICFGEIENLSICIDRLRSELRNKFPEFICLLELLEYCVENYYPVLRGEISGVNTIYPAADINFLSPVVSMVEKIYNLRYQCRILTTLLKKSYKNKKLSILEVGGGVGQITWKIISELDSTKFHYTFTDISRFFMVHAKKLAKINNIDCMNFGQLDISRDAEDQGFNPASFDLILALNVIHAAPNLLNTLGNLKKLLKPGGILFIVEHVTLPIWANMAWGVLEGWWSFNDPFRHLLPTMEQEDWDIVLKKSGFSTIRFFPKPNQYTRVPLSYIGILASA
jgi:SAM-dependent methyltransferase